MYKKIGIIGGGSWGTAIAIILSCSNNNLVTLYVQQSKQADEINNHHTNHKYLESSTLPTSIQATDNFTNIKNESVIIIATPSHTYHSILKNLQQFCIHQKVIFCIASKGIDTNSLKLLSDITQDYFPNNDITVIAGPNLAHEVVQLLPCALTIASQNNDAAQKIEGLLNNNFVTTKITKDIITVQVASTFKNIIAIIIGIISAKKYGENCKAYVLSEGLREIYLLSKALGADNPNLSEFAVIGDLVLTSYSRSSRNAKIGYMIGESSNPFANIASFKSQFLVEGIQAAKMLHTINLNLKLKLPILEAAFNILHNNMIVDDILNIMLQAIKWIKK